MTALRRVTLLLAALTAGNAASASGSNLAELQAVGRAIFEKDRAASLASDRLVEASGGVPDGLLGWVTVPSGEGWLVSFVQEKDATPCSRMSVPVVPEGAGALVRSDTCVPLTPVQRSMFLARQTAIAALRDPCSRAYNTVVLPGEGSKAAWLVYLLAATTEPGTMVVGGHARVAVRKKGTDITDYRRLSRGCLTLEAPSSEAGEPVATVVSHVLDDHPIETHVFLSLLHDRPLYVMTEGALWSVESGKIRLLLDGEEFDAYVEKAMAATAETEGGGED